MRTRCTCAKWSLYRAKLGSIAEPASDDDPFERTGNGTCQVGGHGVRGLRSHRANSRDCKGADAAPEPCHERLLKEYDQRRSGLEWSGRVPERDHFAMRLGGGDHSPPLWTPLPVRPGRSRTASPTDRTSQALATRAGYSLCALHVWAPDEEHDAGPAFDTRMLPEPAAATSDENVPFNAMSRSSRRNVLPVMAAMEPGE